MGSNNSIYLSSSENFKHNLALKLLIYILWPFGAFLFSLRTAASKSSYVIFFLFGMLFCWHFNPTGSGRYDDLEGVMEYVIANDFTFSQIIQQFIDFITFDENSPKDIYQNFVIFLSKSFTDNPHFFFALASIPWLFFELNSVKSITSDSKYNSNLWGLLLLIMFILPRDLVTMQNPRFTTGVWLVVYALLRIFDKSKCRIGYFLLICLTPFIHSGFFPFICIFLLGFIAMRFPRMMILLLYLSVPFSYLSYELLTEFDFSVLPLPTSILNWINGYLSEDSYSRFVVGDSSGSFFWRRLPNYLDSFSKTIYLFIPIYLWQKKDEFFDKKDLKDLYLFYLYFFTVVNFIQFVPVLGQRYFWIVRILSVYLWFKIIYPRDKYILILLLFGSSWYIFMRYFYVGAVASSVPLNIFTQDFVSLILEYII